MDKIKSISSYDSAYECLEALDGSLLPFLDDDIQNFCEHFDDFDFYAYEVIDGKTVIIKDAISGDVLCGPLTAEEFYQEILDDYIEMEGM